MIHTEETNAMSMMELMQKAESLLLMSNAYLWVARERLDGDPQQRAVLQDANIHISETVALLLGLMSVYEAT